MKLLDAVYILADKTDRYAELAAELHETPDDPRRRRALAELGHELREHCRACRVPLDCEMHGMAPEDELWDGASIIEVFGHIQRRIARDAFDADLRETVAATMSHLGELAVGTLGASPPQN